ncbi:MAG: PilN domain-containing protein [Deltaproteobacteria bacterium]|nr:PilN domain-containing protein [Deltaproteobacteria bacterium]
MDAFGIEIREGSWHIAHLRRTALKTVLVKSFELSGTNEDILSALKAYISEHKIKSPAIGIGLKEGDFISKSLFIPAPNAAALEGILKFELEKHLPFNDEEASSAFQVLKKDKNIFSVIVHAAWKKTIDGIVEQFSGAGLNPDYVGTREAGLLSTLLENKKIRDAGFLAIVSFGKAEINLTGFIGSLPFHSRSIERVKECFEELARELKVMEYFASGRLEEILILSEANEFEEFSKRADCLGLPFRQIDLSGLNIEAQAAPSYGLALSALGKGKININLATESFLKRAENRLSFSKKIVASAAILFLSIPFSYIAKDYLTLKKIDAAIMEIKAEGRKVEDIRLSFQTVNESLKILDEIKGEGSTGPLDVLRELTELMPKDSWITDIELKGSVASLDGVSDRASLLLLKMERSKLMKDFEFTGPVVKGEQGKEKFKIKFRVTGATEDRKKAGHNEALG